MKHRLSLNPFRPQQPAAKYRTWNLGRFYLTVWHFRHDSEWTVSRFSSREFSQLLLQVAYLELTVGVNHK